MEGASQPSSLLVGVQQDSGCPQPNAVTLAMLSSQQGKLQLPLEQPCPAQPVLEGSPPGREAARAHGAHPEKGQKAGPWYLGY